jgi:glutamine synthetase
VARELFGDEFVSAFLGTREAQARELARTVSDVELERFFELA